MRWNSRNFVMIPGLALACLIGCGDDDETEISGAESAGQGGEDAQGGEAGKKASAGSPAKAGSGGTAGKSTSASNAGGAGGAAGSAAKPNQEEGGAGGAAGKGGDKPAQGEAGKPAAGSGGAGGAAGGAPVVLPDLSNVTGNVLSNVNSLSGITFAADGKIYASGEINVVDESKGTGDTVADKYRTSVVGHKLAVLRFLANGKADESFADKGLFVWESPGGDLTSMGLAETSDGVVVSVNVKFPSKRTGVALLKLDTTGKLVSGFGDNGRKDLVLGWTDADLADYPKATDGTAQFPSAQSWDIKATDGGTKLVVFAHEPAAHGSLDTGATPPVQRIDNDRYIVRVNAADGQLDPTFNAGKPVVVNTSNDGAPEGKPRFPSDGGRRGFVDADGSIVSSGYTNYQDDKGNQIVLIRLNADGSFDAGFHKERSGQPVQPGVAVFNPVPEVDKGFAECYGVVRTAQGYVTTGYGRAFGGTEGKSTLGYFPSTAVDMVSTRFTGTDVDTTYGRSGLLAAQSEVLGDGQVSSFEDRGRTSVIALAEDRTVMGGRFGQYPALFVVTAAGQFDARVVGKKPDTNGFLLFPTLTSDKQPATSAIYGLARSADGKRIAASTNNHQQGAVLAVLEVKDDGTFAAVKAE